VICVDCFVNNRYDWTYCFCRQVLYCHECQEDGNNAWYKCPTCSTLYCSNQKGDCGHEYF
jgi:hypothetical protein